MKLSSTQKKVLALPVILVLSMLLVSYIAKQFFTVQTSFILCFVFYWIVWCYGIPIIIMGRNNLLSLYSKKIPSPKWLYIFLILTPFVGTIGQIFIPEILNVSGAIILATVISAIINGPGEELFWRGLFINTFSENKWLGIVYPSIFFGLWHFAPLSIGGLHPGWLLIVFGPVILGLCWGWVAYNSKSIFWISIAHILVNFFALIGRMFF